jgi:hypothetical protein
MSMKNPALARMKASFFSWAQSLFWKRVDVLFLGISGLLLIALYLYMGSVWNTTNRSIQFTPEDIVYGQPLYAKPAVEMKSLHTAAAFSNIGSSDYPQIRISENFFDFGEINSGQVVSRTFVIANTGQSPLILLHAYSTCGCTTANFTASEIPPGKVALMTIQFNSGYHDMHGTTVRRGVVIETNDPGQPTQEIWIQATVR